MEERLVLKEHRRVRLLLQAQRPPAQGLAATPEFCRHDVRPLARGEQDHA